MATRTRTRRVSRNDVIHVKYLNGDLTGWADPVEVESGTTVEEFLDEQLTRYDPDECQVRVNRDAVEADYVLQDGDTVSVTPAKIEGA